MIATLSLGPTSHALPTYITPSAESLCPDQPCLTLQQLSDNTTHHLKSNTTLEFLPGNHRLASELIVRNVDSLSILSNTTDSLIMCDDSGRFTVASVVSMQLKNLRFIDCKGNKIVSVKLTIQECTFLSQTVGKSLLASNNIMTMLELYESSVAISATSFITSNNNTAFYDGAMLISRRSNITLLSSHFTTKNGKALAVESRSHINVKNTAFCDSTVTFSSDQPTLIQVVESTVAIESSTITNNTGEIIVYVLKSNVSIHNTNISLNNGTFSVIYMMKSDVRLTGGITYSENHGPFLIKNCFIQFEGSNTFVRCKQRNQTLDRQALGTVTSIQSKIEIHGTTAFHENHSEKSGGAMYISESLISIYGSLLIINNTANLSGGGVFIRLADMFCHGHCKLLHNKANESGGGIHAFSAVITLKYGNKWEPASLSNKRISLTVSDNEAKFGGGAYFEVSSKLYGIEDSDYQYSIEFVRNNATLGGAVFIQDNTYTEVCVGRSTVYKTQTGCFFQTLYGNEDTVTMEGKDTRHLIFANNTAHRGSVLYGGLLDRCTVSLLDDLYNRGVHSNPGNYNESNALAFFQNESGIKTDDIASDAVRICYCNGMIPNCSLWYEPSLISVKKGERFNIALIAVDQVGHAVNAMVHGSLSGGSYLGEDQQLQNTTGVCTNLTFNISSPYDSVDLGLYVRKGPCKYLGLSKTMVKVYFKNCTCPVGFQPSSKESKMCYCECDQKLKPYLKVCDFLGHSFIKNSNSWIDYIKDSGYIIYPNCPYDFCISPTDDAVIKLQEPNGADAQCDYKRSGLLCGQCKTGLSLSIGTPHCVQCSKHWPVLLAVKVLAGILGGIILVVILLVLNMTVALGTLNGLIFYANIVLVNRSSFLRFSRPNFVTVFINLLNTQLGLEYCFYEGMDEYGKTWLSIGFPLYLLGLVIVVIMVSKYSSRCARLLGKSNPVAALASLVLLTYEGLLRAIIDIFSFANLEYPDNSHTRVWRPDASVKYLRGKHIPLFLTGIVIIIIGIAYTLLLFSWQWLLRSPNKKIFKWVRNTKLNSFIEAYHAPYKPKYRYWTGLLLFVRAMVSVAITANVSGDLRNNLLMVGILTMFLVLLKSSLGEKIYRNKILDTFDGVSYFNLLLFTLASLYSLGDRQSQKVSANISVSISFVMFLGVLVYHIHCTLMKVKCYRQLSHSILQRLKQKEANASYANNFEMTAKVPITPEPSSSEVSFASSLSYAVKDLSNEERRNSLSSSTEKVPERKLCGKHPSKEPYMYNSNRLKQPLL